MGISKISFEEKQAIIIKFLQENKDCSQGDLARQLMLSLGYESEISARVSIGKILEQMKELNLIDFNEQKPKRGYIPMKVWYVC